MKTKGKMKAKAHADGQAFPAERWKSAPLPWVRRVDVNGFNARTDQKHRQAGSQTKTQLWAAKADKSYASRRAGEGAPATGRLNTAGAAVRAGREGHGPSGCSPTIHREGIIVTSVYECQLTGRQPLSGRCYATCKGNQRKAVLTGWTPPPCHGRPRGLPTPVTEASSSSPVHLQYLQTRPSVSTQRTLGEIPEVETVRITLWL